MSGTKLNADGRLGLMLTELRLPAIKRLAGELCDQSDREGWPARQLLERLFEHEMTEREVRRFERHRAASSLSPDKRLSSFDFTAVPTVSRARIMALTEGHEWLDRGTNLLAFGPPGSGKSHLLSGTGGHCSCRRAVRRIRCPNGKPPPNFTRCSKRSTGRGNGRGDGRGVPRVARRSDRRSGNILPHVIQNGAIPSSFRRSVLRTLWPPPWFCAQRHRDARAGRRSYTTAAARCRC